MEIKRHILTDQSVTIEMRVCKINAKKDNIKKLLKVTKKKKKAKEI